MVREKVETIAVLAIIFLLVKDASIFGFCHGSAWWTHFSYPLFHASWMHLAGNCYALWFVYNRIPFGKLTVPTIYAISVAASFLFPPELPTIGFSGAIFAMAGINVARNITKKSILSSVFALSIGFVLPSCNGVIHLVSFLIGFIILSIYNFKLKFNADYQGIAG